ncbi:hypothetical protein BDW75DRAFT_65083 [Aspergillus navahoensis]
MVWALHEVEAERGILQNQRTYGSRYDIASECPLDLSADSDPSATQNYSLKKSPAQIRWLSRRRLYPRSPLREKRHNGTIQTWSREGSKAKRLADSLGDNVPSQCSCTNDVGVAIVAGPKQHFSSRHSDCSRAWHPRGSRSASVILTLITQCYRPSNCYILG